MGLNENCGMGTVNFPDLLDISIGNQSKRRGQYRVEWNGWNGRGNHLARVKALGFITILSKKSGKYLWDHFGKRARRIFDSKWVL